MSTVRSFVRREPVVVIAALAAVLSCCFVPPDREYLSYLDWRTLALLYCLITIVNGLCRGLFAVSGGARAKGLKKASVSAMMAPYMI